MRWARLAGLALAAAALTAVSGPAGTGSAAPAARAQPAQRAQPERPAQLSGTQVELVDQTTWLDEGEPFDARLRVTRPPAGAAVQVTVYERLLSRTGFQETEDGDLGDTDLELPAVPVAMLPSRGPGTVGVGFPTDGSGVAGGTDLPEGVYPVEIKVVDGGGRRVAGFVTYVVVRPPESPDFPPLAVSMILDIASPPALQPDGTIAMSDETVDRLQERVSVLEESPAARLTVAPRPETLDGLAALGDGGPELLAELRDARGSRPVLARPYTDVDIAALMDAGEIAELNSQADGGANVVRSRLGTEPTPGVWLSDTTLDGPAAQMLVDLGVGRAVVPPEAVGDVPGVDAGQVPAGTITLGDGGPVTMVSDSELAEQLGSDQGVLGAQRFVAELAILWLERPAISRGVVVHIPPDVALDPTLVDAALTELDESRVISLMGLDKLFSVVPPADGDTPPVATPAPHQVTSDLSTVARRVTAARAQVGGYDGTVGDPEAGQRLADSLLLATGADTPEEARGAYVDQVYRTVEGLRDVISAPSEFRITLTSRSSEIPLNLTNDSNQPVTVRVELESDQLEFPGGDVMTETLDPGGNRIAIPVRTRASGAFPLNITVTSPNGAVVLESTRFDIRSTAVSGVGLVLSIGAGLFLAIWWARHWRSARRARRLLPTEDIPAAAPPGTPARGTPAVPVSPHPEPSADQPVTSDAVGAPGVSGPDAEPANDDYHPAHMAGHRPRRR
jgi:Family of unknown function (DUF6049)